MRCPKCNEQFKCPCKACVKRLGPSTWVFHDDDTQSCPCGERKHVDEWMRLEWEQYKAGQSCDERAVREP